MEIIAHRVSPRPIDHMSTKRPALATISNQQVDYLQPKAKLKQLSPCNPVRVSSFESSAKLSTDLETPMVVVKNDTSQSSSGKKSVSEEDGARAIMACADYRQDVLIALKEREVKLRARPTYMDEQTDINTSMRAILIDWLVEVTEEFRLCTETLHLAVNFIDRFLSIMHVQRNKLQLVGASSMLLACKLEEIHPPDVSMFVEITDNTYTSEQVKTMEIFILRHLNYELSAPTSFTFLHGFAAACNCSEHILQLALYFCELALLNSEPFLKFLPSRIAAASLCLARYTLERGTWSKELRMLTGFSLSELHMVISPLYALFDMHSKPAESQQAAIARKYSRTCHLGVANTVPSGVPSSSNIETTC